MLATNPLQMTVGDVPLNVVTGETMCKTERDQPLRETAPVVRSTLCISTWCYVIGYPHPSNMTYYDHKIFPYFAADNLHARRGRFCNWWTLGLMYVKKVTTPIITQRTLTI